MPSESIAHDSSLPAPIQIPDRLPRFCHAFPTAAILLVSILGLFLELLLIRWIGTEIRIFAYLQNTVLVVCFLGLGMGCFTCRKSINLYQMIVPMFILLLLMAVPFTRKSIAGISEMLSVLGDFVIWSERISNNPLQTAANLFLGLVLTYVLMHLIWSMFIPVGRMLGRLMDDHPRTILAYSINIGGSLLGIWLFVLLSALYLPPVAWVVVLVALTLPFVMTGSAHRRLNVALLILIVPTAWFAGRQPGAIETLWSPYQKLVLYETPERIQDSGDYTITVNNCGYQAMIDLSPDAIEREPDRFPPEMKGCGQYDLPTRLHPNPRNMMIVGSGSGNDAAAALRNGVEHVTAVEIDPAIIALGRRYHPEQPYASPRVRVVNDDARSFFANCDERFDVISFGLLDSHTMTAMTNARLDHYVYTRESLRQAQSLLKEGGIITLTFEAQKPYIADRMGRVLREVFGQDPLSFRVPRNAYGWGGAMFVTGDLDTVHRQIAANDQLAGLIRQWKDDQPMALSYSTPIATDDWPYIYLESRRVPALFFLLAALMALLLLNGRRQLGIPRLVGNWTRTHWHFFFLGAAFLLLEVQNISRASVVLGNTWQVNAVIISGILTMILLANMTAARFPKLPIEWVYVALCGCCLGLYSVDLSSLAFLPYASKAVVLGGLTALPMFFSGIIFIRSFARESNKHEALGANMIGALVGGLLQSITFLVGLKALLLIVTGFYLIAMLTRADRAPRQATASIPQVA